MKVRKLKKQETGSFMPRRGNCRPGAMAIGVMAVFTASLMIIATTGLAKTDEGWGEAELIETGDGRLSNFEVAMNGDGSGIVVWQQYDGTRNNIWSNRYVVGVGWDDAELVEANDVPYYPLQVAVDEAGNAIAVWEASGGEPQTSVWSNRYVVGVGWGNPELIETDDGSAGFPQVAMDGDGNAIAVWRQFDGTRYNIWSNRYLVGVGWGDAELIETDDEYAGSPRVAMDGDGNAIAVWVQSGNIYSNRYLVGVGWGDAEPIEAMDGIAGSPQVAVDEEGNAIAVWHVWDGTRSNIWSNRYVVGAGWGDAQLIETDDEIAGSPQVAMDGDGNAIAVWEASGGEPQTSVWSNRYVVGVGWGNPELIAVYDGDLPWYDSRVAVDEEGNAIAVWVQSGNIYSNRYLVGVGWGDAELIETDDEYAGSPRVAMDGDGNAIAVWQQYDGTSTSIWSNRFNSLVDQYQHRHCYGRT